ncbi:hypothetical protein V1291_004967 [Nitrobacteraceae bacterium AZCC 1564]
MSDVDQAQAPANPSSDQAQAPVSPLSQAALDRKNELVFRLVYVGFLISGAIALLVIGGVIFIALRNAANGTEAKMPEVLANWGGVIVGFYFGAFVTLIKDYIKT